MPKLSEKVKSQEVRVESTMSVISHGFDKRGDYVAVCVVNGETSEQLITQEWLDEYFGETRFKDWSEGEMKTVSRVDLNYITTEQLGEYLTNDFKINPDNFLG